MPKPSPHLKRRWVNAKHEFGSTRVIAYPKVAHAFLQSLKYWKLCVRGVGEGVFLLLMSKESFFLSHFLFSWDSPELISFTKRLSCWLMLVSTKVAVRGEPSWQAAPPASCPLYKAVFHVQVGVANQHLLDQGEAEDPSSWPGSSSPVILGKEPSCLLNL